MGIKKEKEEKMSDPIDDADLAVEMNLKRSLSHREPVPELTGFCMECDEPTPGAFCDSECRESHERRERMARINGRREG